MCPPTPARSQVGLAGQAPGLLGLLSADLAVGGVAGATAVLTFGTLTPHLAAALGRRGGRAAVAALLLASLGVAGWASVQFSQPYRWEERFCLALLRMLGCSFAHPRGPPLHFAAGMGLSLRPLLLVLLTPFVLCSAPAPQPGAPQAPAGAAHPQAGARWDQNCFKLICSALPRRLVVAGLPTLVAAT